MGIIVKVEGTELRKDTKAIIACILLREIMTGIWVEKVTKTDSEHKAGTYQIVRPTRGHKQKVVGAVEKIVNGCSGLDRHIAYMEINSIWNGKKCFAEVEALEGHIKNVNAEDMAILADAKVKARTCVELMDELSAKKGIMKYIKLILATVKFGKCAKNLGKLVKSMFAKSELHLEFDLTYNLKDNIIEIETNVLNEVVSPAQLNA